MKPYPLGLDNPYVIRGIMGTSRWGLYHRESYEKVAEFANPATRICEDQP